MIPIISKDIYLSKAINTMPPTKRKRSSNKNTSGEKDFTQSKKRVTKVDRERLICKKKLDALEEEESQTKEDRFNQEERRILIKAYNENGFNVFQDTGLLHKYFPNRKESDLKGLVQRLRLSLQSETNASQKNITKQQNPNEEWQKLCQLMMGNFAKDRKVNLEEVYADVLLQEAQDMEAGVKNNDDGTDDLMDKPDYPKLLRSFAQLLMGRFPDNINPINAQLSMKLFEHLETVVDSIDLEATFPSLYNGRWLEDNIEGRHLRQEMALKGLKEFDGTTKKCPTFRDIEKYRNIEALCLELPKIKRITDVLNPLHLNESLVSTLMEKLNETSS